MYCISNMGDALCIFYNYRPMAACAIRAVKEKWSKLFQGLSSNFLTFEFSSCHMGILPDDSDSRTGECNTIISALILYRHLEYYCTHQSKLLFDKFIVL